MCKWLRWVLICVIPVAGIAQNLAPSEEESKLRFHVESAFGPLALAGSAAYAGILQGIGTPREWGQGANGYGKRVASEVACVGIRQALAFGLDSTLHQNPRYYRSADKGFWRRSKHALRGTIFTRTDGGAETLSTWRLGSAYGAAFLSNQWYPDRLNTVRLGFIQGTIQLGFDLAGNLGAEFWPDIKRKLTHRKP